MMDILIAGIGQTQVGEHWDVSLRELAFWAMDAAFKDAGEIQPQAIFVGNMLASNLSAQSHLSALLADFAGYTGIEAVRVEAADASGGAAIRMAYLAIASGQVDAALVVGVEKFTDQVGPPVDSAMATMLDADYESIHGLTPAAQAAMVMRRYLYEFDAPRDAFGAFPVAAHAAGEGNPMAMFQKAIRADLYQKAGMVCEPLNIFDEAPAADGAAALLLTRQELIPGDFHHRLIRITGSSLVVDRFALHDRQDLLTFPAAVRSARRACRQAECQIDRIDLFELHDAYSIYAALSLEAIGLAERGQGWKLAQDGEITLQGKTPVGTMGGLKARGFPGGATGVYQAVEAVLQLRGDAGKNQLHNAKRALIQNLGGAGVTAVTHILERVDP